MASRYSRDELNKCSKKVIIDLFMSMQDQMTLMNQNIELLTKQIAILNQNRFGRSTEKLPMSGQLSLDDCFNEAEVMVDSSADTKEPEMEEICPNSYKRHKSKGKREANLSGIETEEVYHELSKEECCSAN